MGHGNKTYLIVKEGQIHRRLDLIEPFMEIEWFLKKPKLFFIQACAVKDNRKRFSSCKCCHFIYLLFPSFGDGFVIVLIEGLEHYALSTVGFQRPSQQMVLIVINREEFFITKEDMNFITLI